MIVRTSAEIYNEVEEKRVTSYSSEKPLQKCLDKRWIPVDDVLNILESFCRQNRINKKLEWQIDEILCEFEEVLK